MNKASMLKSRIPDTHYRSGVRRWNTRHGEREAWAERERNRRGKTECACERDLYSEELTLHYTLMNVVLPSSQTVSPLFKVGGVWMHIKLLNWHFHLNHVSKNSYDSLIQSQCLLLAAIWPCL